MATVTAPLPSGILECLPPEIRRALEHIDPTVLGEVEEIRLRSGRPLELIHAGGVYYPTALGVLRSPEQGITIQPSQLSKTLERMAGWSLYAVEEQLRQGFLTLRGGHRCGVVGRALAENGRIRTLVEVSGLNIRIVKQQKGTSHPLLPYVLNAGRFTSTLLVGPPLTGKTTLLRDLVRLLAGGEPSVFFPGLKVALLDERGEIAASHLGTPSLDVGPRTDVLEGASKEEGLVCLLRSMSPDILATDEIGGRQDARALWEAEKSGVAVLATAHAFAAEDLWTRPSLAPIMDAGIFQRIVFMRREAGRVSISEIRDGGSNLLRRNLCLP